MKAWIVFVCIVGLTLVLLNKTCEAGSIFSGNKLGEIVEPVDVRAQAMGGTSLAFVAAKNASKTNPAVWCTFDQTGIGVMFTSEQRAVKDSDHYEHSIFTAIPGGLKLYVPVRYDIVLGGGFWPYTRADWSVVEHLSLEGQAATDSTTYQQSIERTGGIHLAFLGAAKKVRPWLWLGVSFDFAFGNIKETWRRSFERSDWMDTEDVITRTYSGLIPTIGLIYLFGDKGAIGASYTPQVKVDSPVEMETLSEWSVSQDKRKQTTLPTRLAAGATYHLYPELVLSTEVKGELWERAYTDQERYHNVVGIGSGVAYLPIRGRKTPYYQRISVYLGGYIRSLYYENGRTPKAVKERFLSFGLGFPLTQDQGAIDLSFELGKRGDLSENDAEEMVYRQSIAVSGWEKWFQRD